MVEEEISNSPEQPQASFNHIDDHNEFEVKTNPDDGDETCEEEDDGMVDYKFKYRNLKRKLKCLLYEQECFHEELRKFQRKCMRVNRDKSFLLDRLLQYEQPEISSDDENTSSSEEEAESVKKLSAAKNKKSGSKSSPKTNSEKQTKNTLNAIAGDKVRCRRIENGKQCPKLVSIKVKSGICYAHRQQLSAQKQSQSSSKSSSSVNKTPPAKVKTEKHAPKQAGGGKDIGQIREAMEANARLESSNSPGMYGEEDDDLVIDLPH